MKYLRLAFVVIAASALITARAEDEEERKAPPVEIPDFSNLDEYIYEPKSTVILSFRHLGGAKTSFSGSGSILAPTDTSGLGGYYYHDGAVRPDARTAVVVDSSGNPMIDPATGQAINVPIAPDGKTNTWNYIDKKQADWYFTDAAPSSGAVVPAGYIAFHNYSAEVGDIGTLHGNSKSSAGLDLAVSHDMGKLWGGRIAWSIIGGMSVNDISAKNLSLARVTITTKTSYYSVYGKNPPDAGYSGPTTTSLSSGTDVTTNGSTTTVSADDSTLISSSPDGVVTTYTDGNALNNWKVKGAYYTFRGGLELSYQITSRLRASVSFGPAIIYSGSTYTITQTITPDTGADITEADTEAAYKLLPAYFADANLQFDVTDKTGFFAGAVFQSGSSYTQSIHSTTSNYSTKIDFSNQDGFRAGMSIRF